MVAGLIATQHNNGQHCMTSTATVTAANNLRAAKRYAQAGYPVLLVWPLRDGVCACSDGKRCKTPGKHPVHKKWQLNATVDVGLIEKWWAKFPDAHVGIEPPEGHCIIDIDPRNGGDKTIKERMQGHKLPSNTPIQVSGGGGLHLVLKGDVPGPIGKGVDIKRHRRGFVVAWPAGHISGGAYKWRNAPWDVKPVRVPEQLLTHAGPQSEFDAVETESQPTTVPLKKVRDALAFVNADDYQRWINIGQALRHNYGDDGESVWLEWSRTSSKFQDSDEDKWGTFDRNRDRPLITVRSIMSIARRSGYRPLTAEFSESLWARGDISGMLEEDAPTLDWVFEPCIPAGKVTLLAGAGGSSKSFLALTLALQLAVGDEFGAFKPASTGKALMLVGEEDKDDIHRRLRAILKARMYTVKQCKSIEERVGVVPVRGLDWRLVYHDESGDVQETDRVDYLIDEVCGLGDVRLVVLDPLVAFNGAAENDNMEMSRLMFTLDRIADRTGAAVVVLHHVSKGGQVASLNDSTQAVIRGASALVDNARSAILLARMPRSDAPLYGLTAEQAGRYVVMRVVKNNYGPHVPDQIFSVEAGGALRLAPEVTKQHHSPAQAERAMRESEAPQRILRAMLGNPAATQRDLGAACGLSPTRINQVMQELLEEKQVRRIGVGAGARYEVTPKGREECGEDLGDIL